MASGSGWPGGSCRPVLGAVLVGGASRRMGRHKALIVVDAATMVDRTAGLLRAAGCEPVVAIGPPHLAGDTASVPDRFPGEGPLGAIVTALEQAIDVGAGSALVLACDLPALDVATVAALEPPSPEPQMQAWVVVAVSDRREPLVARWSTGCAAPLRQLFEMGQRSVHRAIDVLEDLTVHEVVVDPRRVRNVNTPDQQWSE